MIFNEEYLIFILCLNIFCSNSIQPLDQNNESLRSVPTISGYQALSQTSTLIHDSMSICVDTSDQDDTKEKSKSPIASTSDSYGCRSKDVYRSECSNMSEESVMEICDDHEESMETVFDNSSKKCLEDTTNFAVSGENPSNVDPGTHKESVGLHDSQNNIELKELKVSLSDIFQHYSSNSDDLRRISFYVREDKKAGKVIIYVCKHEIERDSDEQVELEEGKKKGEVVIIRGRSQYLKTTEGLKKMKMYAIKVIKIKQSQEKELKMKNSFGKPRSKRVKTCPNGSNNGNYKSRANYSKKSVKKVRRAKVDNVEKKEIREIFDEIAERSDSILLDLQKKDEFFDFSKEKLTFEKIIKFRSQIYKCKRFNRVFYKNILETSEEYQELGSLNLYTLFNEKKIQSMICLCNKFIEINDKYDTNAVRDLFILYVNKLVYDIENIFKLIGEKNKKGQKNTIYELSRMHIQKFLVWFLRVLSGNKKRMFGVTHARLFINEYINNALEQHTEDIYFDINTYDASYLLRKFENIMFFLRG